LFNVFLFLASVNFVMQAFSLNHTELQATNTSAIKNLTQKCTTMNTNCYWRQRFRGLLRCHLQLATYRSASLVTVCGDVCHTPKSLLVSSPELAHLRTIYFALYKCTYYYYYYYLL